MTYIDPNQSDREFVANDPRLSRRQAAHDRRQATLHGGLDAALFGGPFHRARPGWTPLPTAMTPSARQLLLREEREGRIVVDRAPDGSLLAYTDAEDAIPSKSDAALSGNREAKGREDTPGHPGMTDRRARK